MTTIPTNVMIYVYYIL